LTYLLNGILISSRFGEAAIADYLTFELRNTRSVADVFRGE